MKRLSYVIFLSLLYFLQSTATTLTKAFSVDNARIVNGTDSTKIFYHACSITMVNLATGTIRFGGGSIISKKHVLTTASLVSGYTDDIRIDYRPPNAAYVRITYSEAVAMHPQYNAGYRLNDIAIIFCVGQFPAENRIPITSLVPSITTGFIQMIGIGYGLSANNDNSISKTPYYANATISDRALCKFLVAQNTNEYCAHTNGLVAGVFCKGDLGNGLVSDNKMWSALKTTTLVGIVTKIEKDACVVNQYDAYLSFVPIGPYERWIKILTGLQQSV